MRKKAIIVTALAGFVRSFLTNDILILQDMGYEVHCAANIYHSGSEGMKEYFKEKNIIFHQVEFSSNKPISKQTITSYKKIKKLLQETKFDVIHCHTPIAGAITRVSCRKQRKNGTKVIYTTHGFYFHRHSSFKTWLIYRTFEDLMSYISDAIITINREDFKNAKKMHCKYVYYIPGVGVDTNRFINTKVNRDEYRKKIGIDNDEILVLAVGELSERKNHQIIIKALSECKDENIVFMICGNAMTNSNTKKFLEELAKENGVNLRLMGLRKDIPQICKCADIGVMPSKREGLGLSGIEMLASGLPVVASNVHGIVDYISDGVNGYLCNPNDFYEFARAIKKLVPKSVRLNMKENCVKSAEPFDKKCSDDKMRKIYKEILSM